ncbi:MAG: hypothetical protein U0326_33430 [Polyangiales bacterium]
MSTTFDASIPDRAAGRRLSPARAVWFALLGVVSLASGAFAAACFLHLAEANITVRASAVVAYALAVLVALLFGVAIPLRIEARVRRGWRRLNPLAPPVRRGAVALPVALVLPILVALLAPDLVRASLQSHAAWAVRPISASATRSLERAGKWAAARVPRRSPIALTHATSLHAPPDAVCTCH